MNKKDLAFKVYEKMMEKDYCSQWMGIELEEIDEGYCKIKMEVRKEMLNGYGILHGGIAYSFADSAFAFASNSYGRVAVSISGGMHFFSPAKKGDLLIAEAKLCKLGHKTAHFDVSITSGNSSDILYEFRGTVYRKSEEILN